MKKNENELNVLKSKNEFKNKEFENKKKQQLKDIEHKYLVREKQLKAQLSNLQAKS